MTAAGYSLWSAGRALARGWQGFFHAPCDARIPALVRIAFAAVALVNLAVLYPDLDRWFTNEGVLTTAVSQEIARPHAWSLFWHLPATSAAVQACFWIAVAQAAMLLVGLLSRLNAACLFVWLVSFQNRNIMITDSEDTVMRLIAFFLIWMPIERCWSVDAWVGRHPHPNPLPEGEGVEGHPHPGPLSRRDHAANDPHPNPLPEGSPHPGPLPEGEGGDGYAAPGWGLRLLQLQMCFIFLSAGISKLGGDAWLDGTALYYVARLDDYFGRFPTPDWPFDNAWAVAIFTWAVIAIELLAPLLIWFRETRRLALAMVVLFHLANEWTMHLHLFHWVMLVGWMTFLQPQDFAWLWPKGKERLA